MFDDINDFSGCNPTPSGDEVDLDLVDVPPPKKVERWESSLSSSSSSTSSATDDSPSIHLWRSGHPGTEVGERGKKRMAKKKDRTMKKY